MIIDRAHTLAGLTISAKESNFTLTIYKLGNVFSDDIGEIIAELPEYDIEHISDSTVESFFIIAKKQYDEMKKELELSGN